LKILGSYFGNAIFEEVDELSRAKGVIPKKGMPKLSKRHGIEKICRV
jgi:hypothetical protein